MSASEISNVLKERNIKLANNDLLAECKWALIGLLVGAARGIAVLDFTVSLFLLLLNLVAGADLMHQFGLDADELANSLEAAISGSGAVTAADLSKARQTIAKQAAKNPRRSSAITPDSMGPRYDASTIHAARAVSSLFLPARSH